MALSKDDLAKLPDETRAHYVERDGGFVFEPKGFVPETRFNEQKTKLEEFRDRNRDLNTKVTELEPLKAKLDAFADVDADEYRKLKKGLKDKGVSKLDDLESLLNDSIAKAVAPITQKLEATEKRAIEAQQRADQERLQREIANVAREARIRAKSVNYVTNRAGEAFTVKDGNVVARDGKYSPADPTKPLSVDEWLKHIAEDEDLYEASTGSGASPVRGKVDADVKELVNPTSAEKGKYLDEIASGKMRVVHRA